MSWVSLKRNHGLGSLVGFVKKDGLENETVLFYSLTPIFEKHLVMVARGLGSIFSTSLSQDWEVDNKTLALWEAWETSHFYVRQTVCEFWRDCALLLFRVLQISSWSIFQKNHLSNGHNGSRCGGLNPSVFLLLNEVEYVSSWTSRKSLIRICKGRDVGKHFVLNGRFCEQATVFFMAQVFFGSPSSDRQLLPALERRH